MKFKYVLITAVFFITQSSVNGQNLDDFNQDRLKMTKQGMLVLGSWATANIIASPFLAADASGSDKYFQQMNGYWNGINLLIAGFGYFSARKMANQRFSLSESLREQQKLEKTLLFNAGLDIGYMLGGLYMIERSKNDQANANRFRGFGESLLLQGGFLFAFDVIFYLVQKKHGAKLFSIVDNLALSPSGFRVVWKI